MPSDLFLIDTSVWLLALKKDGISEVRARVDHLLKEDRIVTTGIVKMEILGGTRTSKEFQRLKSRLDVFYSVEADSHLWDEACDLTFNLRRKGVTVPYTDILVAASAMKIKAVVVHADAHYDLIAKHAQLGVESFLSAVRRNTKKKTSKTK